MSEKKKFKTYFRFRKLKRRHDKIRQRFVFSNVYIMGLMFLMFGIIRQVVSETNVSKYGHFLGIMCQCAYHYQQTLLN